MVDTNFDTNVVRRRAEVTGHSRRRRWTAEAKGRIVGEAVAPGAVIAEVARRHDLVPQHLSNWIRAAKDGRFAIPADEGLTFVPIVPSAPISAAPSAMPCERTPIEIAVGSVVVRVANGADASTLELVLRAVRRVAA